jgi:hypothetical protein
VVHHGNLRGSRVYEMISGIEIVLALHIGFLLPSYLEKDQVVWAVLGIWAALIVVEQVVQGRTPRGTWLLLAGLTLAHVLYHGPGSRAGLWAFGMGALLGGMTPQRSREPEPFGTALLFAPVWLVWWSHSPIGFEAWPVLTTVATLLLTGAASGVFQRSGAPELDLSGFRPRVVHQTLTWVGFRGTAVNTVLLWIAFIAALSVQFAHYEKAFAPREMALLAVLQTAFFASWLFEGKLRKGMLPYFLMQVSALALYVAARRQAQLTGSHWRDEFDIWASLAMTLCLAGAKPLIDRQPRELRMPLFSALYVLPAFSVAWVLARNLSVDMALLVVGLHSAAFAYMGKDDRESPYHVVAVGGFTAFVLLVFWNKLHLGMIYAYVVPVGTGLLILLKLLEKHVPAEARNQIRLAVTLAMVGSTGYYVLLDEPAGFAHNGVLAALSLAAMALGPLLKVRLYSIVGFAALMVDAGATFVRVVGQMERSLRMTAVGSVILLVGAALVFGAIYYKANQAQVAGFLQRWRARTAKWE